MTTKVVCCCGVRTWTKVIAWLQIIGSALGIILMIIVMTLMIIGKNAMESEKQLRVSQGLPPTFRKNTNSDFFTEYDYGSIGFSGLIAVAVISIIMLLVGLVTGILLLRGANENNTRYLKWWIAYAVICLVWSIISTALSAGGIITIVIQVIITLAIYGFLIWIVWTLVKEIEMESGQREMEPPKYNSNATYPVAAVNVKHPEY